MNEVIIALNLKEQFKTSRLNLFLNFQVNNNEQSRFFQDTPGKYSGWKEHLHIIVQKQLHSIF